MPIQTTSIFLGSTPIPVYYLGDKQASLNPETQSNIIVRNDAFAQYIKLAMPYSLFPTLGMNEYYDNIAALISGSGTSLPMVPTGSNVGSAPPILETTSSIVSSGSYNFVNDGYQTSVFISGSQNAGTVTGSLLQFSNENFVFECWFNYNEASTEDGTDPFNMFLFGTNDGNSILLDAARTTNQFRLLSNIGTLTPAWNETKNVWFHIAHVRSGGNLYIYLNGNRIASGTATGTVANPTNGYWRILGNSSGNNNDGAGKLIQDLRLYIGTDKNYTGSLIPVPESIVTTINL